MTPKRRWHWGLGLVAVLLVVGPCAVVVGSGRLTVARLEALLDRKPTFDEVAAFLQRQGLTHYVTDRDTGGEITAYIDTVGAFEATKVYRIRFGADRRMTGYDAHLEVLAP